MIELKLFSRFWWAKHVVGVGENGISDNSRKIPAYLSVQLLQRPLNAFYYGWKSPGEQTHVSVYTFYWFSALWLRAAVVHVTIWLISVKLFSKLRTSSMIQWCTRVHQVRVRVRVHRHSVQVTVEYECTLSDSSTTSLVWSKPTFELPILRRRNFHGCEREFNSKNWRNGKETEERQEWEHEWESLRGNEKKWKPKTHSRRHLINTHSLGLSKAISLYRSVLLNGLHTTLDTEVRLAVPHSSGVQSIPRAIWTQCPPAHGLSGIVDTSHIEPLLFRHGHRHRRTDAAYT